jgi:hypothetical protein
MEFNFHTSTDILELAVYIQKFVSHLSVVPVTYTHKTYRHDATEILLTMMLNTITIALTLLVTT